MFAVGWVEALIAVGMLLVIGLSLLAASRARPALSRRPPRIPRPSPPGLDDR